MSESDTGNLVPTSDEGQNEIGASPEESEEVTQDSPGSGQQEQMMAEDGPGPVEEAKEDLESSTKAQETVPAKDQESEPSKDQESEPSKDQEPEPSKDQEPEPSKDQEPEFSKDQEPEPAKDQEPEPSKDQEHEPSKDQEPEPSKDQEPEPAKDQEPDPLQDQEHDPMPEQTPASSQGETTSGADSEGAAKEGDVSSTAPAAVEEKVTEAASSEPKDESSEATSPPTSPGPETAGAVTEGTPEMEVGIEDVKTKASEEPKQEAAPKETSGAPKEEEAASKAKETSDDAKTAPAPVDTPNAATPDVVVEGSSTEQRVAIITGANTGIGLVAAGKLAKDGYEVILACRSEEKASKAIEELKKKVPGARVSFMKLDLGSLRSVREFADAFLSTGKPLHVLCNNAGLTTGFSVKERRESEDGFEMTMGVNHLGHFLLTHLLLDNLKRTASRCGEARVVHTSSMVHDPEAFGGKRGLPAHLDFDNLMLDKPGTFGGELAYKNSKLANCVFSVELAKRLEGTNITSNTLCPGFIPSTGLTQNETLGTKIKLTLVTPFLKLFGITRTVEQGGSIIHYVATQPELKGVTGKHFLDFKEILSSKESRDPDVCKKLWDISADLVKYEQAKDM